jgi:hypothetical protein
VGGGSEPKEGRFKNREREFREERREEEGERERNLEIERENQIDFITSMHTYMRIPTCSSQGQALSMHPDILQN